MAFKITVRFIVFDLFSGLLMKFTKYSKFSDKYCKIYIKTNPWHLDSNLKGSILIDRIQFQKKAYIVWLFHPLFLVLYAMATKNVI